MALDIQQALGDAGAPPRFSFRGKEYVLRFKTLKLQAEFVRWAKERWEAQMREIQKFCTPDRWDEEIDDLKDKLNKGFFDFNGEYCTDLRGTEDGMQAMLRITLGDQAKDMTDEDLVYLMAECGDQIELAFTWFHGQIDEISRISGKTETEDGDPKVRRRLLAERGLL